MTLAIESKPSPNADDRPDGCPADCIILHYTGMQTAKAALERLTDPDANVSAHYLVHEDGAVMRLVEEHRRAWHAGISCWQGQERLNDRSIGIEIVNPGHEWGYRPFTEAQYRALEQLVPIIMNRWTIEPSRVLGHSDIAPDRKEDPGELFDWKRLSNVGIGLWPKEGRGEPRPLETVRAQLAAIGYHVPLDGDCDASIRRVVTAFQRRFRPERVDGDLDRQTLTRLDGMLALLPPSRCG